MDKVNQEKPKSEKPQTDENKRRVVETGASNNYQLVVRKDEENLMRMTGNSYMQETVTAGDLDNFHVYEAMKHRENEYMA